MMACLYSVYVIMRYSTINTINETHTHVYHAMMELVMMIVMLVIGMQLINHDVGELGDGGASLTIGHTEFQTKWQASSPNI